MNSKNRRIMLYISIGGVGVCTMAIIQFIVMIVNNNLPWTPGQTVREHYLAVGHGYTQGFASGFFLCFFLIAAATVAGTRMRRSQTR